MKYPKIAIRGSKINSEAIKNYFKKLGVYNDNYTYELEDGYYWIREEGNIVLNSKNFVPENYTFLETVPIKIHETWTY